MLKLTPRWSVTKDHQHDSQAFCKYNINQKILTKPSLWILCVNFGAKSCQNLTMWNCWWSGSTSGIFMCEVMHPRRSDSNHANLFDPSGGDQSASDGLWPPTAARFSSNVHKTREVKAEPNNCEHYISSWTRNNFNFVLRLLRLFCVWVCTCVHTCDVCVCLFVHVSGYRQHAGATNESTLSLFFRSLLPNFNLQVSCMDKCLGFNWDFSAEVSMLLYLFMLAYKASSFCLVASLISQSSLIVFRSIMTPYLHWKMPM